MLVIADNSPLRYLIVIDCVHVLPVLFGRILLPTAVVEELQHPHTPAVVRAWMTHPPACLEVRAITGEPDVTVAELEVGEQEAIVLARELHADLLLIDDGKGREIAFEQGLHRMGTVGVLEQAAISGLVDFPTVIARLLQTNFRITADIINDALARDAARKAAAEEPPPDPQET
jgi:predicted nucleic acid-binding protein